MRHQPRPMRFERLTCGLPAKSWRIVVCAVLIWLVAAAQAPAYAQATNDDIVFPSSAGMIDVRAFGAVGDGVTDDTAAIQAAFNSARGLLRGQTVYLRNGTYLVRDRLVMTDDALTQRTVNVQGQSVSGTIIKLDDGTPGFDDTAAPRAVLTTFHPSATSLSYQNTALATSIRNLTVDVGANNPGAAGITYIANNQGTLRDVVIRSSDAQGRGYAGLDLSLERIPGPALVKRVTVQGFDYGIRALEAQYSMVFEDITLHDQHVAGVLNSAGMLSIRKLSSRNSVPAVRQYNGGNSTIGFTQGMVVLLDSVLSGGAADSPAIDLEHGFLFVRNLRTSGYGMAIDDGGTAVPGPNIMEWKKGETESLFASPQTSLNLPVRETPDVPRDDPSTWADVTAFGAIRGDAVDDSAAIQAAMDSGATTVYFPNAAASETGSQYVVTQTITVGGNVRRIVGMSANIRVNAPLTDGGAVFKFVDGTHPVVVLEDLRMSNSIGRQWFVEQASSRTLVLRQLLIRRGYGYRNSGFGDVFIEDFHSLPLRTTTPASQFVFTNQRVWARQLNPEQTSDNLGAPLIVNDGASLWILGLKTEQAATLIETRNGGQTEVLGGFALNSSRVNATVPAFVNTESSVSLVHLEYRQSSIRGIYPTVVQETRAGATRTLASTEVPNRTADYDSSPAYVLPLYTGYRDPATIARLKLTSLCSSDPATRRVWRVRNTNQFPIRFTWDVYGSPAEQAGSALVAAASGSTPGETVFTTATEAGPNTLRVFIQHVQQDVKASNPARCG